MNDERASDRSDAFVAGPTTVRKISPSARGEELAVLEAYDANQHALYTFARSLVRDPETAEDLVGDAFLKLIREVAAGRAPDRTRPWLFRVVANQVVNQARRRAVAARFLSRLVRGGTADAADVLLLRREAGSGVREALLALPPDTRTALLLAGEGFSGREIAAAIGRSDSAARTLMSRGRVRLRELLEAQETER